MASGPWQSNAVSRIEEFIKRNKWAVDDIETLKLFARRLEIDPLDVSANQDLVGEWYARLGPSKANPTRSIGVGYLIDKSRRIVDVISFETYPTRL